MHAEGYRGFFISFSEIHSQNYALKIDFSIATVIKIWLKCAFWSIVHFYISPEAN